MARVVGVRDDFANVHVVSNTGGTETPWSRQAFTFVKLVGYGICADAFGIFWPVFGRHPAMQQFFPLFIEFTKISYAKDFIVTGIAKIGFAKSV